QLDIEYVEGTIPVRLHTAVSGAARGGSLEKHGPAAIDTDDDIVAFRELREFFPEATGRWTHVRAQRVVRAPSRQSEQPRLVAVLRLTPDFAGTLPVRPADADLGRHRFATQWTCVPLGAQLPSNHA